MQTVSSSPSTSSCYPILYQPYPSVPNLPTTGSSTSLLIPPYSSMHSPQSIKSFDTTVYGPSVPSATKNSKISTRSNDVDLRRLILFNLPIDLVREYLELYLEHLSGEAEIERIDYSNLDDTTVMVTFKTELGLFEKFRNKINRQFSLFITDMAEVRRRHATRSKLNDSEITLVEVTPPATVMIRNLPVDISRDVLELYFSNRRRSDGGQVTDVTLDHENQHALVTFADHKGSLELQERKRN